MKEFTSLTPVSKIQLNHQPGPHSPQPQSVSERPLERPTLVRPQRTSTVLIQNNEANQVKLSWIIRFNANWFLDLKCCSLEKVTALVIHSGVWMHVTVGYKGTTFDEFCCLLLLSKNLGGPIGSLACKWTFSHENILIFSWLLFLTVLSPTFLYKRMYLK